MGVIVNHVGKISYMINFNFLFRLFLTFNATSLLFMVYAVQNEIVLIDASYFFESFGNLKENVSLAYITYFNKYLSYLLYIILPVFLTGISIFLSSCLGCDSFKGGEVIGIEYANNSFLPSYLGYFFVALSIDNIVAFFIIYGVIFIFTFLSQALYFNPLFLLFGYNFFNVKTKNGLSLFLISKDNYRKPDDIVINRAYRINNYTYIEKL